LREKNDAQQLLNLQTWWCYAKGTGRWFLRKLVTSVPDYTASYPCWYQPP